MTQDDTTTSGRVVSHYTAEDRLAIKAIFKRLPGAIPVACRGSAHGGDPADWDDHMDAKTPWLHSINNKYQWKEPRNVESVRRGIDMLPLVGIGLQSAGTFVLDNDRQPLSVLPLPGGAFVPSRGEHQHLLYRRGKGTFKDTLWKFGTAGGEVREKGFVVLWRPREFLEALAKVGAPVDWPDMAHLLAGKKKKARSKTNGTGSGGGGATAAQWARRIKDAANGDRYPTARAATAALIGGGQWTDAVDAVVREQYRAMFTDEEGRDPDAELDGLVSDAQEKIRTGEWDPPKRSAPAPDVPTVEYHMTEAVNAWLEARRSTFNEAQSECLRLTLRHRLGLEDSPAAPDAVVAAWPFDRSATALAGKHEAALDALRTQKPTKARPVLMEKTSTALKNGASREEVEAAIAEAEEGVYEPLWIDEALGKAEQLIAREDAGHATKALEGALKGVCEAIHKSARGAHDADIKIAKMVADRAGEHEPFPDRSESTFRAALEGLGTDLRRNVLSQCIEQKDPETGAWEQWTDDMESRLRVDIENTFTYWTGTKGQRPADLEWTDTKWNRLVQAMVAEPEHQHNPMEDYLQRVRGTWDGRRRREALLADLSGSDPADPWLRWGSRHIQDVVVVRTFEPGAKCDEFPILRGPAGMGKSVFLEGLIPPELRARCFTAGLKFTGYDSSKWSEMLEQASLAVADECVGLVAAKSAEIKQFVAAGDDSRHRKYGRNKTFLPRRCALVGTINPGRTIPLDPSNRKIIPLTLGNERHGQSAVGPVEPWMDAQRDQLWAEAMHDYDAGEITIGLPSHLNDMLDELEDADMEGLAFAEDIAMLTPRRPGGARWTWTEIATEILAPEEDPDAEDKPGAPKPRFNPKLLSPQIKKEFSDALKKLGWATAKDRGVGSDRDVFFTVYTEFEEQWEAEVRSWLAEGVAMINPGDVDAGGWDEERILAAILAVVPAPVEVCPSDFRWRSRARIFRSVLRDAGWKRRTGSGVHRYAPAAGSSGTG